MNFTRRSFLKRGLQTGAASLSPAALARHSLITYATHCLLPPTAGIFIESSFSTRLSLVWAFILL